MKKQYILMFLFLESLLIIYAWKDLLQLYYFSYSKGLYSYMFFIPFVSAYFFYIKRNNIFSEISLSVVPGTVLCFCGISLYVIGKTFLKNVDQNDYLSIVVFAWLIISLGLFTLCFGWQAFKNALFPILFLFLIVPIPSFLLNEYTELLRKGSEEVSYFTFNFLGVPVFRFDNVFQLPNFTIEVAKECSGIRSSMGLWITAILSSYLFLNTNFYRFLLLLSVIPIAIIKNGLRIVTLGLLASYVDPMYITNHWLHRSGGILYFTLALILLFFPWMFFLKSREAKLLKGTRKLG